MKTKTSTCPSCGMIVERTIYDIGSGPELSCANCEWCWGADGQDLNPITYASVVEDLGFDPMPSTRDLIGIITDRRAQIMHRGSEA